MRLFIFSVYFRLHVGMTDWLRQTLTSISLETRFGLLVFVVTFAGASRWSRSCCQAAATYSHPRSGVLGRPSPGVAGATGGKNAAAWCCWCGI